MPNTQSSRETLPHRTSSPNRRTIVLFDEAIGFGGSVVVLSHLLRNLDRSRYRPLVVTSLDPRDCETLFDAADILCRSRPVLQYADRLKWMAYCPTQIKPFRKLWAYAFSGVAALINLPRFLEILFRVAKSRPAVIHVNNGKEGLLVSRLLRLPLVWHLHGVPTELVRGTYNARRTTSAFISISRFITSEVVRHGADPARIHHVPNPAPRMTGPEAPKDMWASRLGFLPSAFVFSHIGRLVRWKGQREFLQAFEQIAARHPHAIALIVGDDVEGHDGAYPKELREFVRTRGLDDRVFFAGHVDRPMDIMALSDVVVHSSIEPEPFGLVIVEAMSAGAAVIAARSGAPVEIVEHGVTGLLVDPSDTGEFAAALQLLISDDEKRTQIALAGYQHCREQYSPELFATRIMSVYESTACVRSERNTA